jgi:hypothetical protein
VSVEKNGTLNDNLINKIYTGYYHSCSIYSPSSSCFFIPFNDSKVCNGNGKIKKKILKN